MVEAKATEIYRDTNNKITGYKLIDKNGSTRDFKSDVLKELIRDEKIDVVNLTLTKDNRLLLRGTAVKDNHPYSKKFVLTYNVVKQIIEDSDPGKNWRFITIRNKETLQDIKMKLQILGQFDNINVVNDKVCTITRGDNLDIYIIAEKIYLGNSKWSDYEWRGVFYECNAKSLDLRNIDTSHTNNMSALFQESENLEHIYFADTLDTSNVENMSNMFNSCMLLKDLDLSKFNTSKVRDFRGMFVYSNISKLDLSSFDTRNVENMSNMFGDATASDLDLSNFVTPKLKSTQSMFGGCYKLKKLNLQNFDTHNIENMACMFWHCNALEEIDLQSFRTPKVESMEHMFYDCTVLKHLDLRNFEFDSVKNMNSIFSGCESLIELNMERLESLDEKNKYYMFDKCKSLDIKHIKVGTPKAKRDIAKLLKQSRG